MPRIEIKHTNTKGMKRDKKTFCDSKTSNSLITFYKGLFTNEIIEKTLFKKELYQINN